MSARPSEAKTTQAWVVMLDAQSVDDVILSPDERTRARQFRYERDAFRFAACRTVLRTILGACCGTPPAALLFEATTAGRPLLSGRNGPHFSVARAGDFALIAIAKDGEIGIDLESQRALGDPSGVDAWLDHVGAEPGPSLLQRWVRAEAIAKAVGTGLPGLEAGLLRTAHGFYTHDLDLGGGLTAAIALPGHDDWHIAVATWSGAPL